MDKITEYIKKAFDYKDSTDYKQAIDYFYKALAVDNNSIEIMNELASLYCELCQYDRAISLYEQILSKNSNEHNTKLKFASLCIKLGDTARAKQLLIDLYNDNYKLDEVTLKLFPIMIDEKDFEQVLYLYKTSKTEINASEVLYYVGFAYLQMSCNDLAEDFFKRSIEQDKNNIHSGLNIAKFLVDRKLFDEAEKMLKQLLEFSENDKIFALLAEIRYQENRIEDAITYYSYAIKINTKVPDYYYKLGVLYSLNGFVKEAEYSYGKAVALDEENLLYNYTLAYLYYMNKKYELSSNLVNYILKLDPEYSNAISLKVLLLLQENEVVLAKSYIEKVNKQKDKDDFAYYVETMYYSKLNLWENAISAIKKAIDRNPDSIDYKYELAKNYFYADKKDFALNVCEEILKINPKYIQAYVLKAKIYYEKEDIDNVLDNLSMAMKLDINVPEVYMLKGLVSYKKEQFDEAITNFKIALSINPSEEHYYSLIAKTYYQIENYKEAYTYYKEAAGIDITNSEYYYYMAKCSVKLDDKENALAHFSVMKRLSPINLKYTIEYAEYMAEQGLKKSAEKLLKSTMKMLSNKEDKDELNILIKKIKK